MAKKSDSQKPAEPVAQKPAPEKAAIERPALEKSGPSPLWTEQEYADFVRKSIDSVRKDRVKGLGPRFTRVVGAIRYRPSDIFAYLDANSNQPAQ